MGDHADDALNEMMDLDELQQRYSTVEETPEHEMENLYDYDGSRSPHVFSRQVTKISGPGVCPKCGGETVEKVGKLGSFYGCVTFPKCNGSISA